MNTAAKEAAETAKAIKGWRCIDRPSQPHEKASKRPIPTFLSKDCSGFMSISSPMQWHDSVSPKARRQRRKAEKPASDTRTSERVSLKQILKTRKTPSRNSAAIRILAATEHRSNPANPKENRYNSKPSMEESFETDETMKIAPKTILASNLKITQNS